MTFMKKIFVGSSVVLLVLIVGYLLQRSYNEKFIRNSVHTFSLSKKERNSLNEFFCELLFQDGGAYTLHGTKPLTFSLILKPLTKDELEEEEQYLNSLSKEKREKISQLQPRFDHRQNCLNWEKIKPRFTINQYLFGKFTLDKSYDVLLFLNIEMTIRTLIKYYEDFKRTLGYDFDPFQIVFDVENPNSKFWNTIARDGHALLGILLGYGQANSWFFEWNLKYEEANNPMGNFIKHMHSKFYDPKPILFSTSRHFSLPSFRSYGAYSDDQKLVNQYKQERRKIKSLYKWHDPVDVALTWLTR